jgi:signal transduction histidine kinase
MAVVDIITYSDAWAKLYTTGTFIQMLTFFLGVVYNFNEVRMESINQKVQLLELKEEKEKILINQNKLLEEKVNERTNELQELNEEMVQQNEELMIQRLELEYINEELHKKSILINELNDKLKNQNADLELTVQKRTIEIYEAYSQLKEKNSKLEQFAYVTSHNLRGPIATLLGLVQLIPRSKPEDVAELIDKIHITTKKLDMVIKGLSNLLDIQKNYSSIKEKIRLSDTLEDVIIMLQKEINDSKTTIVREFDESATILAIPIYLNNILYNLLNNAIKYSKPNIAPQVIIKYEKKNNQAILTISDNGLGLDLEKNRDKLFFPFRRFHANIDGTGLGLFIVKTQIEAMNGKIEIESTVGVGTTFYITLPENDFVIENRIKT